ncbi:MAG: VOC family protein [Thermoleophilia bacterium]|nr:VOC family protein [Thermoleophilia bacterium]
MANGSSHMQKITTNLWFDTQAKEAAEFYTSTFSDSKIINSSIIHGSPSGDVDILTVELMGREFTLISAGPLFKLNPSISFLVGCRTKEEVDELWQSLSAGGTALMELGSYPFSERYGWIQDRYGVSWQIMFMGDREILQSIIPTLMFVGDVSGKAEGAVNFYASVFNDAKVGDIMRYEKGDEPEEEGTIKHARVVLEGQEFAAMDSARMHDFAFNEAISLVVSCDSQAEVDHHWDLLSAVSESEQCGWLKDKYGVSWQIVPNALDRMMADEDQEKVARVTEAFLKMKKLDIAELEAAYANDK